MTALLTPAQSIISARLSRPLTELLRHRRRLRIRRPPTTPPLTRKRKLDAATAQIDCLSVEAPTATATKASDTSSAKKRKRSVATESDSTNEKDDLPATPQTLGSPDKTDKPTTTTTTSTSTTTTATTPMDSDDDFSLASGSEMDFGADEDNSSIDLGNGMCS